MGQKFKVIHEEYDHKIPMNEWERLKTAYRAEDWDTIYTFTAGHEIDTPTLMRQLERDCR
jgi:predicted esterase